MSKLNFQTLRSVRNGIKDTIIYVTLSAIMAVGLTYGADKKGSELPSATSVTSSDKAIIIQDGMTKTVTYGNVPHNSFGGRTASDSHSQGAITGLTDALNQKLNKSVFDAYTSIDRAGGGTSDHGSLIGLSDNDHPQYTLNSAFTAYTSIDRSDVTNATFTSYTSAGGGTPDLCGGGGGVCPSRQHGQYS